MDLTALLYNLPPLLKIPSRTRERPKRTGSSSWEPLHRLGSEQSAELVRLYSTGESVTALAARYDMHRCTIQEHLDRHGANRQAPKPKLSTAQITEAGKLYETGLSLESIGNTFGVHASTIATHLKRAGYELRPRRGWLGRRVE